MILGYTSQTFNVCGKKRKKKKNMKSKLLFLKMENNGGANHELMLVICAYITQGVVRKNDIV